MEKRDEKYQIGAQSGHILWDITSLLSDIDRGVLQVHTNIMNVSELVNTNNFNGNPDHAMNTDIQKPIIIAELGYGKIKIIDGNHRLYKAKSMNYKEINTYYLRREQHCKYIIDFDEDLYDRIVSEF